MLKAMNLEDLEKEVYRMGANRKTIAFCGSRGVPGNYGGFETAVDEISRRFFAVGFACEVFCRMSSYESRPHRHEGRRLIYVKGSRFRKLDTFVSAFQTGWHLWRYRKKYAYVFWFNNANFPGIVLTHLAGIPMSVNTDGLEWRRAKWSWPFKAYYLLTSFLITRLCDSLICDSLAIQSFYKKTFSKETTFIPYGVSKIDGVPCEKQTTILAQYGVEAERYFLQITRFESDNMPLEIARAFQLARMADKGFKFLLVGYKDETPYARKVKMLSGRDGIEVAHAVYDREILYALRENAFCYVHGNSVGGTNPALLEAMASCPRVMAIDGPFSREVLGDTGSFFSPNKLASIFPSQCSSPKKRMDMRARVKQRYDWDAVTASYLELVEKRSVSYSGRIEEALAVCYEGKRRQEKTPVHQRFRR